jgi:hypothetical protein
MLKSVAGEITSTVGLLCMARLLCTPATCVATTPRGPQHNNHRPQRHKNLREFTEDVKDA